MRIYLVFFLTALAFAQEHEVPSADPLAIPFLNPEFDNDDEAAPADAKPINFIVPGHPKDDESEGSVPRTTFFSSSSSSATASADVKPVNFMLPLPSVKDESTEDGPRITLFSSASSSATASADVKPVNLMVPLPSMKDRSTEDGPRITLFSSASSSATASADVKPVNLMLPLPSMNDESTEATSFSSATASAGDHGTETASPSKQLPACPQVTSATPVKERIRAWLCEYTKYTVQTIEWTKSFEVWWSGCKEAEEGVFIWEESSECPNTTMVRCKCQDKLKCMDDGMGCKRCLCTDGNYKDAATLFKLWRKEMTMFKKRFQIYKSKVESCTRADAFGMEECEADESEFSEEEREFSEEETEFSREERESSGEERESFGEGRESFGEAEDINIHM